MFDSRGNPVSTASADALADAETALWRMASFFDAPIADIDAALARDPGWMFPHLMRANFLLTLTEPALLSEARAAIQQAEATAPRASTQRERAHLNAARRCAAGDWQGACDAWQAILAEHPRDLYALQWAHLFDFYRGDAPQLRERPQQTLAALASDDPLRPYVLGMHAFGLEECHAYAQAEATGREAVDGEAKVPWATHAVAHVMEMQGRHEAGREWLHARETDWSEGNGFAGHHWWHLALFHLEAMDLPAALALYDEHLSSAHAELTLQRLDGAALLWRLQLLGADVAERWDDIAIGWDLSPGAVGHSAFNDLHALLVLLGQHRIAAARSLVTAAQQQAQTSRGGTAQVARDVGLPLMRGLLAFGLEDHAEALRLIAPLRAQTQRFGGSHAQRDLIAQTLLAACAEASESTLGRSLLAERGPGKAETPLTRHWRRRLGLKGI
ncbi:MAG TPA: tetratricopeptide repeat protein [Albitalea sp.]|nr:tetratricopeptide repeat protein [Albitalea sp.]